MLIPVIKIFYNYKYCFSRTKFYPPIRYIENHKENELMEISKQVSGRSLTHRSSDNIQEEGAEKLTERKGTIIIGGRFLCITNSILGLIHMTHRLINLEFKKYLIFNCSISIVSRMVHRLDVRAFFL